MGRGFLLLGGLLARARAERALRRLAVAAVLARAHAHDLGVDRGADAVVHLAVDLGQHVACLVVWLVVWLVVC